LLFRSYNKVEKTFLTLPGGAGSSKLCLLSSEWPGWLTALYTCEWMNALLT